MKAKNTVLTLAAIIVSAMAFAANPVSKMAVINQQKSTTYKIIYKSESVGTVTLTIYDNAKNEVYSETISKSNGFIRPVNFEGMDAGVYTIEITDATGTQIQQVNYEIAEAESKSAETSIRALHVSKLQDGKYLVSIANKGTEEVNIRIFDNNNNLVHNEFRTINGELGLVYNLKEVAGQPVFMVTDNSGKNHTVK
jgi:hypothetical protein